MQITPPKYVQNVLNILSEHGYTACLVGGCVRDMYLNVVPNDWDIATSALPEEVLDIFPDSLTMGIKHGTVTVKCGKELVEVTTFRLDGNYSDHRHPESVHFVSDIKEDLSRRDFTINAIAITHDGTVIDPFNGIDDLSKHIIRAVGIAEKRFEEDALRMFRAFRFSSRLGYDIESATFSAIKSCSFLASSLSAERIRDELEKILSSQHPQYFSDIIEIGLLNKFIEKQVKFTPDYSAIISSDTRLSKWSLLCFYLLQSEIIKDIREFLISLRMDNNTVSICSKTVEILLGNPPSSRTDYKVLLSRYGTDSVENACICLDSLYNQKHTETLNNIICSGECYTVKDLAINGDDLKHLGITGKGIGTVLNSLLDYVIANPSMNNYDDLNILLIEKSLTCLSSEQ